MTRRSVGRIAILSLMALLITACTDKEAGPSSTPLTVDDLEAAVAPAAQALLDADGIEGTRLMFNEENDLVTTDWMDHRPNGDYRVVFFITEPGGEQVVQVLSAVQIGPRRYQTASTPPMWGFVGETPRLEDEPLPIGLDLVEMIDGTVFTALAQGESEVERIETSDGRELWRWIREQDDFTAIWEWQIDADGFLRTILLQSEQNSLPSTRERFELTPLTDPEAIIFPEAGSELDPASLGVPDDLPVPPG